MSWNGIKIVAQFNQFYAAREVKDSLSVKKKIIHPF